LIVAVCAGARPDYPFFFKPLLLISDELLAVLRLSECCRAGNANGRGYEQYCVRSF
jgi:hypothetical protein